MTGAINALLAATSTKSSGSSATFVIFLVLIALVGYFLLIRPQKQRQRKQREQQSAVALGDEILTVGGVVGRVIAVDADRVTILSGGDTVGFPAAGSEPSRLVLVRNAVARKIEPPLPSSADDDERAADHDADGAPTMNGEHGYEGHADAGVDGDAAEGAEGEGTSQ